MRPFPLSTPKATGSAAAAATLRQRADKLRRTAAGAAAPSAPGEAATRWLRALGAAAAERALGARVARCLRAMDLDVPNGRLIELLVLRHHSELAAGAVLVFLPGAREIEAVREELEGSKGAAGLHVLPLHAQLSAAEQRRAFEPPPSGKTKVVLATDVAEASVTIADVSLHSTRFRPKSSHSPFCFGFSPDATPPIHLFLR